MISEKGATAIEQVLPHPSLTRITLAGMQRNIKSQLGFTYSNLGNLSIKKEKMEKLMSQFK